MRGERHGQMKNEIMNGNQGGHVILCDHGVEASKDWVLVAHFIHLFSTMMPMTCTDVHSGAPMSQFLHMRVGMGC